MYSVNVQNSSHQFSQLSKPECFDAGWVNTPTHGTNIEIQVLSLFGTDNLDSESRWTALTGQSASFPAFSTPPPWIYSFLS